MLPKENRVVVEGLNMVQRHTRPTQADPQGGIKSKEAPLHVSNVALVDPKTGVYHGAADPRINGKAAGY